MIKPMWNSEAVKAYESGQGVELVNKPYPHYEPAKVTRKQDDDDIQEYVRPWQGLTEEERSGMRVLGNGLLFNTAEAQVWELAVDFAEKKLRERNT